MNDLKGLKVKDAIENRVLTVDNNGVIKSSNKDVGELATNTDISALDGRITALEGSVTDIENQIVSINGEEV